MSVNLKLKRLAVAMIIRNQFKIQTPAHDPVMFTLEELRLILEQISTEITDAMNSLDPVSHAKLLKGD